MGKYSDKLVNDYINGLEISNVEELENSKSFMLKAMDMSGDYKLYNLCSDKLKKNYVFVKNIILRFHSNIDFICKVVDYYLKNSEDECSRIELVALMIKLTKNDKEKYMRYCMFGQSLYYIKRLQIERAKKTFNDQELIDDLGMGFNLIYEEYNHSKIVLDFFAKKIIDGIFDENDIDLEYMLHGQYDDSDKLNKVGLNNYMLNFINNYDAMLTNYLSVNIELLSDFRNRILKTISNWEKFELKNEYDKYNLMFDKVHEYLANTDTLLDETTILYYLGNKLGIANTILKYDSVFTCSLRDVLEEIDDNMINEVLEFSFEERIHLNKIKKIMIDILFSKTNKEIIDKNKILKIEFKQERNNK